MDFSNMKFMAMLQREEDEEAIAGMSVTVFSSVLVFTFTVMVLSTIVPMDKETAALHIMQGSLFVFIVPFISYNRHSSFPSTLQAAIGYWLV